MSMPGLAQPHSDVAPRKTSHIYMNIHEPRPRAAAIYVDFNQDFMHSGTGSIGIAVLVPLSISISISIRKIDIMEQCLNGRLCYGGIPIAYNFQTVI
jgi:hypothetical protein